MLFIFRDLAILIAIFVSSFSIRCLINFISDLNLSHFTDFLYIDILVFFIRVFITDLFEFYLANNNLTLYGVSQDSNSYVTFAGSYLSKEHKDKTKRKIYGFI